jgi:hypothetical protein
LASTVIALGPLGFLPPMSRRGRLRSKNVVDFEEGDDDLTLTADRGIYFSSDGQRREEELLNLSHKKRRLIPASLEDQLVQWIPVPEDNFTEEEARAPLAPSTLQETAQLLGKRKEYVSTASFSNLVFSNRLIDALERPNVTVETT